MKTEREDLTLDQKREMLGETIREYLTPEARFVKAYKASMAK